MSFDGTPASKLPLLVTAFQYRFGRDLEAMTRHLVNDVAIGWEELGSDLLDGAPPTIVAALTGGDPWPSRTLDNLITPDGSPPARIAVTETTVGGTDVEWGYILRPSGIEVFPTMYAAFGPVVDWDADPLTDFGDPASWPTVTPPRSAAPSADSPVPATPGASRTAVRR
ncbi:hypothetical protein AB0957_01280 [Streptomyces zhihengii]|uniref:hypothetical protein n=1 Tax=Streptomyces zhihengii TaxID=1818004 RepID=UPI0034516A70